MLGGPNHNYATKETNDSAPPLNDGARFRSGHDPLSPVGKCGNKLRPLSARCLFTFEQLDEIDQSTGRLQNSGLRPA